MSKWLAMAEALERNSTPFDRSTEVDRTQPERESRGSVAFCQMSIGEEDKSRAPDVDAFEERAAIIEFQAGLPRKQAEAMAAKAQELDNVVQFWASKSGGQK